MVQALSKMVVRRGDGSVHLTRLPALTRVYAVAVDGVVGEGDGE